MDVLLIARAARYSPGACAAADGALCSALARQLAARGARVQLCDEDRVPSVATLPRVDVVCSMARSRQVLQALAAYEAAGGCVVNSPAALLRGTRSQLASAFLAAGIPQPAFTQVVGVAPAAGCAAQVEALPPEAFPLWVKRGDEGAQQPGDVQRVETRAALLEALQSFASRGIASATLARHEAGDLIKFYGVAGSPFFRFLYPTRGGAVGKFGLERYNGSPRGIAFHHDALRCAAERAARVAGISVYGGDAVVRPDGTFCLIDFNDFPSFSAFRDEAAAAIVQHLLSLRVTPTHFTR